MKTLVNSFKNINWKNAVSLAGFVGAWLLISIFLVRNPITLPSPIAILHAYSNLGQEILLHTGSSFMRVIGGFAIAAAAGVSLGMFMGLSRIVENVLDPIVEIIRPISAIAWIPIGLIVFGIGHELAIFITAYAAFFPIVLNTISGVKNIDQTLVNAARSLGANRKTMWTEVILPGALPGVLVGCRIGLLTAWKALIAAELVGTSTGLGYMIIFNERLLRIDVVFGGVAIIGAIGFALDKVLGLVNQKILPWHRELGRGAS